MGRHAKYKTHIEPAFQQILGYLHSGCTEKSIAAKIGVSHTVWAECKKKYPAFLELIKKGQTEACSVVVNKLYQLAIGYDYEETVKEARKEGSKTVEHVRKTTKHIPANLGAIAIILFNRMKDQWKDKQQIEIQSKSEILSKSQYTPAERLAMLRESIKAVQEAEKGQTSERTNSDTIGGSGDSIV